MGAAQGDAGRTAKGWAKEHDLAVATNLGMFFRNGGHMGHVKFEGHTLQPGKISSYLSVFVAEPKEVGLPPMAIEDLPLKDWDWLDEHYGTLVQNLRTIAAPGGNRWNYKQVDWSDGSGRRKSEIQRWSGVTLAYASSGHILIVFARSPYAIRDLNRHLLKELPELKILRAQHLEGGPEASLYVQSGDREMEFYGSYESGFMRHDRNSRSWPIPWVLGFTRK